MPFCKRTIVPKDVCKFDRKKQNAVLTDLVDVCGFTLCSILRQLSDLSRQSVSILEELEGELVSICHRSGTLENKVISLQKYVSSLVNKPPPNIATNLDSESTQAAHFRSSWQQPVNVFGSWSRPECVRELHQEAELNLQSLLQEFEEQLYDHEVTGETFRQPSSQSSEDTLQTSNGSPRSLFLSASKGKDKITSIGAQAKDRANSSPDRVRVFFDSSRGPPVAEKPRWHLKRTPAYLVPVDVAVGAYASEKTLGVDLIHGAYSTGLFQSRLSRSSSENCRRHLPLRKTYSDLDQTLPQSPGHLSGMMDHGTLTCANPNWNGPKGSTFSPSWNNSFSSFTLAPSPVPKAASSQHSTDVVACRSEGSTSHSMSSGSHSDSFAPTNSQTTSPGNVGGKRIETHMGTASSGKMEKRTNGTNSFSFRERSLSTPTDSGSFSSADNAFEARQDGMSYALLYPSGSSEGSTSADNVSLTAVDILPSGHSRTRSRSISLLKPKKKPPPPVRSVSLRNSSDDNSNTHTKGPSRERRPKSLFIPKDHLQHSFQPDIVISSKPPQKGQDLPRPSDGAATETRAGVRDAALSHQGLLSECKSANPYTSQSSPSAITDLNVTGSKEVRRNSESLDSTSQLLTEAESKVSPVKPPGLMSPSSGYSSQSETTTPITPTSIIMGPSPEGWKIRPMIPERKSSLSTTSPRERAAQCRLSFELSMVSHLDLSSIQPKAKASRRHSDSSATSKPGHKLSPSASMMPLVTQTDLRNVRLRSVSRSEPDDSTDGSSDIIEEEQGRDSDCPTTPNPKPKPPNAVKPPLPKRPLHLKLQASSSSPFPSESPPVSAEDRPMPAQNIYKVVRKPKAKMSPKSPLSPGGDPNHQVPQNQGPCHGDNQQGPCLGDNQQGPGHSPQLSPGSPEACDRSKTLPSRATISCLAELGKKPTKVPPPVPKKPNFLFLHVNALHASMATDGQVNAQAGNGTLTCQVVSDKEVNYGTHRTGDCGMDVRSPTTKISTVHSLDESTEVGCPKPEENESSVMEEDHDDVFVQSGAPHTTEDLFTIIHRSKRKVLGRKEQTDPASGRTSSLSPVKSSPSSATPGGTPRASSRNETFMALLQRKNSKTSGSARVSAMELLRSTNPLARRVSEFSQAQPEPNGKSNLPQNH